MADTTAAHLIHPVGFVKGVLYLTTFSFQAQKPYLMMNRFKMLAFLVMMVAFGNMSCTKNTLNLPEPAQTIEGVYEAKNYQTPFPIEGQTLQLTVRRVATNSVSVLVRATDNGQYRDSLFFNRAYVSQVFSFNCIGYRVDMGSTPQIDQLTMTCGEINVFRYLYKPANQKNYSVLMFKKI
jgi:hypothetical protein